MQKSKSLSALIAALCISVYVGQLFLSGEPITTQTLLVAPVELLHKMGANFAPITLLQNQYWRLLTFGFVHAGIIHLALNAYALLEFGPTAEAALGKKTFAFIYILTGVAGGLTSILVNPLQTSVGASASICGVLGAFIFVSWFKRERENSQRLRKPELILLLVFLSYSLLLGFTSEVVDNGAHLGGFFTGVLAAAMLTVKTHSPAASFRIRFASIVALIALCPVLIEIDRRRMDNNPTVDCYLLTTDGIKLVKEKKYLHGLAKLNDALKIKPDDKSARLARGEAYLELDMIKPALEDFNLVLKTDPKDRGALSRRSQLYHEIGESAKAVADLDNAIKADPRKAILYNNRAWVRLPLYNQPGVFDLCLQDCDQAIKLDRHLMSAYDSRGTVYLFKGDYAKARADFELCKKNKDSADAAELHLAILDKLAGDNAKAAVEFANYEKNEYEADPFELQFYKDKFGMDILDKTKRDAAKETVNEASTDLTKETATDLVQPGREVNNK